MRLIALDTATLVLSAALVDLGEDGTLRSVREAGGETRPGQHSVRLPQVLLDLLRAEGLGVADVDGFVGGLGPGSFTGLRTGLATLKGLAYGVRRPLVGAGSLASMARQAADAAPEGAALVPTLDARRGQVYAGFYRWTGSELEPLAPEAVLDPAELLARLEGLDRPIVFGQGAEAYEALAPARAPAGAGGPSTPSAVGLARLAGPRVGGWDAAAALALVPRYVRRSEAEIKLAEGTLRVPSGVGPSRD